MKIFLILILICITIIFPQMSRAASETSASDMSAIMAHKPEDKKEVVKENRTLFVLETSEEDVSEGLNRIAGEIDLGFTKQEQTYKSSSQKNAVIDRIKDGRSEMSS